MNAETVNTIATMISTVGFPIVCCGALFWFVNKQNETHKEEMDAIRQSLDSNTTILTKLYERLGGEH